MTKFRTHYDNLGVSRTAQPEVIKAAYRALSQKHHPDKNPNNIDSERVMKIINSSYKILSNPQLRAEHDEWISAQEAKKNQERQNQDKKNQDKKNQEKKNKQNSRRTDTKENFENSKYSPMFFLIFNIVLAVVILGISIFYLDSRMDQLQTLQIEENKVSVDIEKYKAFVENEEDVSNLFEFLNKKIRDKNLFELDVKFCAISNKDGYIGGEVKIPNLAEGESTFDPKFYALSSPNGSNICSEYQWCDVSTSENQPVYTFPKELVYHYSQDTPEGNYKECADNMAGFRIKGFSSYQEMKPSQDTPFSIFFMQHDGAIMKALKH